MLTRRRLPLLCALLIAVLIAVAAIPLQRSSAAVSGFVQRCGIHFCLNGKAYYFAGANTYDVFTYGNGSNDTETQYMDKARIDNHFAELAADHVSVLRLWMFSHETWHGFEPTKGVYNEQEFSEFDYILQSAANHGIRLIPTLENYWEAYGGIDTRLTWEGLGTGQSNRWRFFNKTACPGCFTQYKNYVNYALNRVNHYSGVAYKNDPTIFAWDLMNEPRYEGQGTESTGGTTLRAWVDEMGAYIKGIDTNHMVYAGIEGHGTKYGFGGDEGNPFVYIQQSPYIDFTSAHPYPNEGWANLTQDQTITLINAWLADAHNVVGKPFYLGEFNTMGVDRSAWWTAIYNDLEAQNADGSGFWWYPDPSAGGDNYSVKHGAAELAVFKAHSDRMIAKSGGTPPSGSPTTSSPSPSRSTSPSASASSTGRGCTATYQSTGSWQGGFQGQVTVTNPGTTATTGWTVTLTFANGQTITQLWNGSYTQSGAVVTVKNVSYNGSLAPAASTAFGFLGSWNGTNAAPTLTCAAT